MKKTRILLAAALTLLISLTASAARLEVFAAASLTESFQEIGKRFGATHPGDTVEFNFAGSQVLRTQIEQGAPADVFASADQIQMKPLQTSRLVEKPRVFAHNTLIVVTPAVQPRVKRLNGLSLRGIRLVLASENVPAGRYANQVIRAMGSVGQLGPGFERRVMANVVSRETNVRSVLSKVIIGEADAGIVYVTDAATAKGKVNVVNIPARYNASATYQIAVVADSKQKALASDFMRLVHGKEGQQILVRHGFQPHLRHE